MIKSYSNNQSRFHSNSLLLLFFLTRLVGPRDLFAPGLTHIPPGYAPVSAQPNVHGALRLSSLSHQHAEFAHERPGLTLLRHQLAHGPPLHELAGHGLRPQRQPPGEARDRLSNTQSHTSESIFTKAAHSGIVSSGLLTPSGV